MSLSDQTNAIVIQRIEVSPGLIILRVAPEGWVQAHPGIWLRRASETDLTHLVQQRGGGLSLDEVMALALSEEGLDELPGRAGTIAGRVVDESGAAVPDALVGPAQWYATGGLVRPTASLETTYSA